MSLGLCWLAFNSLHCMLFLLLVSGSLLRLSKSPFLACPFFWCFSSLFDGWNYSLRGTECKLCRVTKCKCVCQCFGTGQGTWWSSLSRKQKFWWIWYIQKLLENTLVNCWLETVLWRWFWRHEQDWLWWREMCSIILLTLRRGSKFATIADHWCHSLPSLCYLVQS